MPLQTIDPTINLGQALFKLCLSLPWERILLKVKPSPQANQVMLRAVAPPKPRPVLATSMLPAPVAAQAPRPAPAPAPAPALRPSVTPSSRASTSSLAPLTPSQPIHRPGCTAADEAAVALFHLNGLARGKGGFGVLRQSKERLEKAADAAAFLQQEGVAQEMRAIAAALPQVHTPEEAKALRDRLEPVVYDAAWDLGMRCKGALSPTDLAEIKALAAKIAARSKE